MQYIASGGGLGEFDTVMQTRDVVEGLQNFRESSQSQENAQILNVTTVFTYPLITFLTV